MSETPASRKRLRASDAERDQILEVLQEAYGAGRLEVGELAERQEAALQSRFTDELSGLVQDLPEGARLDMRESGRAVSSRPIADPVPAQGNRGHLTATIMSGKSVDLAAGSTHYRNFAWWGGNNIDVTAAMGPGAVVVLELHCVMAGHEIFVPEGVRVIDESTAIMAGNDIERQAKGDGSNGTLILRGFLWWAGSDVKLVRRPNTH